MGRPERERLLLLALWDASEKVRRTALLALCETADPAMAARVAKRARTTGTVTERSYEEAAEVLRARRGDGSATRRGLSTGSSRT